MPLAIFNPIESPGIIIRLELNLFLSPANAGGKILCACEPLAISRGGMYEVMNPNIA